MKHPSKDSKNNNQNNKADIDPFTGDPIMTPPLSPATITAPPTEFQTNDGVDGVYSANVISTYSGPSSLTSTAADSIGTGDFVGPETSTSTLLAASETILEEPSYSQDSELVECYNEASDGASASTIAGRQVMSPSHKNLGAAIMESYEMEFKKKKESMNLPEHSLLEFGDTVRALEEQRRSVIKQMTVKAKRKDTWIKTFSMHDQGKEDNIPVAPSRIKRKPSPTRPETVAKPVAFIQDTTDSSFSGLPKSEMGFFKSQKSTLENITLLNSPLTSARASAAVEPVADPPKVSRKKKPVEPEHAPAATTKSENCHSITVDCDISLKNTETQLQYLPPPIEVTKDIMEHDMSSQDTTKVDGDNLEEVAVFPEVPEVLAEVPVAVHELVSPAQVAFPPVNNKPEAFPVVAAEPLVVDNCPQSPAASKESPVKENHDLPPPPPPPEPIEPVEHSRTETEEDAMVREKNEINLVHSAMAKYMSHEVTEGKEKTVEVENEEAERIEVASPELVAEGPVSMASDAADLQEDEGEVEYFSILDNKSATKNYWETRMLATMDDGGWESVANVRFQPLPGVTPVVLQTEGSPSTVTPPPEFIPAPPPQFDNSPMESEGSSPPSLEAPAKQSPAKAQGPTKQYVYGINDAAPKEMRSARIVETVAKKPPTQENVIEAEIRAQQMKEAELRQNGTLKTTTVVREKGASSPASHDSDEGFVDRVVEDVPAAPTSGYTHAIPGNDGEPVIYDAVSPPPVDFPEARTPTPSANSTETKIALEIRELKEREEELRQMRERLMNSRENLLDDEEVRSSASREQLLEDHLTSLTTTTDEGNFSECGDPASSEDKSSDGSNRMQKESVIEREIRLAREREEAHRREKGITYSTTNGTIPSSRSTNQSTTKAPVVTNNDGRDVQHRMATSRIQMEIQETSMKERELRDAGKILTMSEERVDAKVTRMSDFNDQNLNESPRTRPTPPRPSNFSTPSSTPKRSPSPLSPSSPVPNFTPSPGLSRGLSRSLSTNNLASSTSLANPRSAPKGLMQKFIASRGKMTGSAFASPPLTLTQTISTSRGIPTRPMRVEPKAAVVQRETLARMKPQHVETGINQEQTSQSQKQHNHIQQQYRRSYCTAEEKIQSELKEMQMREEELRRLRAHQMAQSQPNLLDLGTEEEDQETVEETCEGFQEVNGLRTTLSNPNLLDDESDQTQQALDKGVRRRSALIAQWENRIQQTTDT
ncbi:uncharacterized protein [Panulirus ornatus]|uniref:uncharacterized protein isoform X3 n=1 Tax=Panulirus ornatus TaxID=150431 RepID=UPI003A8C40BE